MGKRRYGISETLDAVDYLEAVKKKLHEHKSDDGKISTGEIANTMITTAPESIKALVGSGDIDDELRDLNGEEKERLLRAALPTLLGFAKILVPGLDGTETPKVASAKSQKVGKAGGKQGGPDSAA